MSVGVASSMYGPTIWRPTGNPAAVRPTGTAVAGQPISVAGAIHFIKSRYGRSPAVVLVSSRDAADYGPLIAESGARGFIAKDELSGATVRALLP